MSIKQDLKLLQNTSKINAKGIKPSHNLHSDLIIIIVYLDNEPKSITKQKKQIHGESFQN